METKRFVAANHKRMRKYKPLIRWCWWYVTWAMSILFCSSSTRIKISWRSKFDCSLHFFLSTYLIKYFPKYSTLSSGNSTAIETRASDNAPNTFSFRYAASIFPVCKIQFCYQTTLEQFSTRLNVRLVWSSLMMNYSQTSILSPIFLSSY